MNTIRRVYASCAVLGGCCYGFAPLGETKLMTTKSCSTAKSRADNLPTTARFASILPPSFEDVTTILDRYTGATSETYLQASEALPLTSKLFTIIDQLVTKNELAQELSDFFGRNQPNSLDELPQQLVKWVNNPRINDMIADANALQLSGLALFAVAYLLNIKLKSPENFVKLGAPYEPGSDTYNPDLADDYFSKRPWVVAKRLLNLASLTSGFSSGLLFDWLVLGKLFKDDEYSALKKAEPRRSKEALSLIEKLGPTFIKLGQALSIRTDLIPELYALELRKLQDAVPAFDSDVAYQVLGEELGVNDLSEIFSELSSEPVASASIGQVYKGRLRRNGKEVAVKVQRPGILAEISLDLYLLRLLMPIQTTLQNAANGIKTTPEDIGTAIALVDEWGRGFVAETDYRLEALNTVTFEKAMRERGLDAVCAPPLVEELTREKVLVTEWVEGTRLDASESPDVPRLCGVAINAYLTMLLDTGVLHCDPHPGNLLRTTDGRLCILDWGMTLAVPDDLQYAFLEFIAHINTENFEAIPQDFINLGFSPPDVSLERLQNSGISEGLSFAFRQLSAGGGAAKIQKRVKAEFQERYGADLTDDELRNAARAEMMERMEAQLESEGVDVQGVTNVMEEMSRRNKELFAVPPYILYVVRAFSTLEGIGLSIDENYSIIQECYPYLSRRLFTDRSPRAKSALREMLGLSEGGEEKAVTIVNSQARQQGGHGAHKRKALQPRKLVEMSKEFATYTASTANVDQNEGQTTATTEFLSLFLDPDGSTIQEIFVDETAKLGDAATRQALKRVLVDSPGAKAAAAALQSTKNLFDSSEQLQRLLPGTLRKALVDRPAALPGQIEKLVSLNAEDKLVLANAQELRDALGPVIVNQFNLTQNTSLRSAFAQQIGDGASALPSSPVIPVVDEATRRKIQEQIPGVTNLARRAGASLVRRAAYRAMEAPGLSDRARQVLIASNSRLAEILEPEGVERD